MSLKKVTEVLYANWWKIHIKVIAGSSRSEIGEFLENGILKIKLKAPREKGKANQELISLLSKSLGIRKDAIHLISWELNEFKELHIEL